MLAGSGGVSSVVSVVTSQEENKNKMAVAAASGNLLKGEFTCYCKIRIYLNDTGIAKWLIYT
jgi:hypothetical protein